MLNFVEREDREREKRERERNSGNFRNELGHFTAPITADTHSSYAGKISTRGDAYRRHRRCIRCRDIFVTFSSAESFMPDKCTDLCYCDAWIPLQGCCWKTKIIKMKYINGSMSRCAVSFGISKTTPFVHMRAVFFSKKNSF